MSLDLCTVKTFLFDGEKFGVICKVRYDVEIPLSEFADEDDLFGHLVTQQNLPIAFHEEVQSTFRKFVITETQKFMDGIVEKNLADSLKGNDWDVLQTLPKVKSNLYDLFRLSSEGKASPGEVDSSFEEYFKFLMRNSTVKQLSRIVEEEQHMSGKMSALIRARDFEMERLTKACENAALGDKSPNDTTPVDNEELINKQSYNLSMLNDKLRQVSTNYCHQIAALQVSQRHVYREFIENLYKQETHDVSQILPALPSKKLSTLTRILQEENRQVTMSMKKSLSCDSRIFNNKESSSKREECFTIYIGAQMKTMHNARILLCDRLSDLCQSTASTRVDLVMQNTRQHYGSILADYGGDCVEQLFNSRRLQLLMSLYRRELTSVVLVVGRDPLHHVRQRTSFYRLCEQSAELHFDSFEEQLKQIEIEVLRANRTRRSRNHSHKQQGAADSAFVKCGIDDTAFDETILQSGDVYITCHSNLSSAQVVFHLVTESGLEMSDISSRHPCIAGLRNIIRIAARCAVKNISIPLLLVESMNETMTVPWCTSRVELVFKCLKGFLMEVSATGANGASAAAGAGCTANSANFAATTHFNINFALPRKVTNSLFNQTVDLFSAIFHLVPSLTA